MTTIDPVFAAFYAGKDSAPSDRNLHVEGSPEWHAWRHGHAVEHGERVPMSDADVAAAFAALNAQKP